MDNIFHDINNPSSFPSKIIALFVIAVLLGIGTGFILTRYSGTSNSSSKFVKGLGAVTIGAVYGSGDTATFKDVAEGIVQKGGIENEGQFHLVRPGGKDQYVYLTSSLVDLNQFINHKVKVYGQTQKAKVAGWLMDVGKLEVEQ